MPGAGQELTAIAWRAMPAFDKPMDGGWLLHARAAC